MDSQIWAYLFGALLTVHGLGFAAGTTSMGNRLFGVVWLLGLIGFISGLAFRGFWAPQASWRPLTVASAVPSIVLLVLFWTSISGGPKVPAFPGSIEVRIVPSRLDTSWTPGPAPGGLAGGGAAELNSRSVKEPGSRSRPPGGDPNRILDAYRSWHADEGEPTPGPSVIQRLLDDSDKNTDLNKTPVGDEGPLMSPYGPSWRTPHYYLQFQPTAEQARMAADLQRMQPKVNVIDTSVPWSVTPITPDVAVRLQQIRGAEVPMRATREIVLREVSIEDALGTGRR